MFKRNKEFRDKMYEEYLNGASLVELSKKYKTDAWYQFSKYNYKLRDAEEKSKWISEHRIGRYKFKWNCEKINDEQQAYTIGLLMADGYVTNNGQIGVRLKKSDEDTLLRIKNVFSEQIKLQEDSNSCSFVVSSKVLVEKINLLGICNSKTKKELSIPQMPEYLIRHFIRGYFDGDGTIFVANRKSYKYLKSNICSPTINILEEIKNVLLENGIEAQINTEKRIGKKAKIPSGECVCSMNMNRLYCRKKDSIEKFYHFLYDDSTIYLKRKKKIFDENLNLFTYKRKHVNAELTNPSKED